MVDEVEGVGHTVGQRLRAAREAQGLSLEEVASRTRIPTRHLQSIEESSWDRLPAPTYSIGFAKSYASVVGLDRTEIGESLRSEMGGTRLAAAEPQAFEPVDPARVMPRWLVIAAVLAVLALIAGLLIWRQQSLTAADDVSAVAPAPEPAAPLSGAGVAPASPASAPAPSGPVVLTATEPVWLQIYERGGSTLFQGELGVGQNYQVPATATAPLLRTGKPETLRITVGTSPVPAVGPAATTVRDISLLGPDLMRGPAAAPNP